MTSPTVEKKEHEVGLGIPSMDGDSSVAPTMAATSADAVITSPTETPANGGSAAAGVSPTAAASSTPHREKEGFFGRLVNKEKARAPTSETTGFASSAYVPGTAPAVASENLDAPAHVRAPSGEYTSGTTPEAAKEKRRSAFFGKLGGSAKKDRKVEAVYDGENAAGEEAKAKKSGLSDIFRRPSKLVKSQNETRKETASAPAVPEVTEASTNHHGVPLHLGTDGATGTMDTTAATADSTTANRNTIGDVVPDAVSVEHPESRTHAAHASA